MKKIKFDNPGVSERTFCKSGLVEDLRDGYTATKWDPDTNKKVWSIHDGEGNFVGFEEQPDECTDEEFVRYLYEEIGA